jgi:Predicted oxidoreductase related to nitroreductase
VLRAVELSPSSFNSQSSRVVILWGNHSHKLWDIAKDELKVLISEEAFKSTSEKLDSFARGSGTILFFEDSRVIDKLQEQFPSYADNFPLWSEQSSGMAQFAVWAALTEAGLGASLQHYNRVL